MCCEPVNPTSSVLLISFSHSALGPPPPQTCLKLQALPPTCNFTPKAEGLGTRKHKRGYLPSWSWAHHAVCWRKGKQ